MERPLILGTTLPGVQLKQLRLEDAPAYFEAVDANREHLSQFGDQTGKKYPTVESVEASIKYPDNPNKHRMGIWDRDIFVGTINMTLIENNIEIGYWLDEQHTGMGYATVATRALATYAKRFYPSVYAGVNPENLVSQRVLERAGFNKVAGDAGRLVFEFMPKSQQRS
jgi:RimJ/RimL family protein N-acetyltransferase